MFSSTVLLKLLSNLTEGFSFEKISTCLVVNKATSSQRGTRLSLPSRWGFYKWTGAYHYGLFSSSFVILWDLSQMWTRDGFSDWNSAQLAQITLFICKLFPNANKLMCSSPKSVKIATSAVGVRRRTLLISYPDFPRPSGRETCYFKWRHTSSLLGSNLTPSVDSLH